MTGIIVTKLRREDHGELEANLSIGGTTVPVTRKFGSWGTIPDERGSWIALPPRLGFALQERARRFERREAADAKA